MKWGFPSEASAAVLSDFLLCEFLLLLSANDFPSLPKDGDTASSNYSSFSAFHYWVSPTLR